MNGFAAKMLRYTFSWSTMIFYDYSLRDVAEMHLKSEDGRVFRELSPADRSAFQGLLAQQRKDETIFAPVLDMDEALRRMSRGGCCVICEEDGEILGYAWFSPDETLIVEIQATVRLEENEIYAHNAYVKRKVRGDRIIESIVTKAATLLHQKGFTRCIIAGMSWNTTIHRIFEQMGFSYQGRVRTGYFLGFRYCLDTCENVSFIDRLRWFDFYKKLFGKMELAITR